MNMTSKDIRKMAFAVGFGITFGKTIGGLASAVVNGVALGISTIILKDRNPLAEELYEKVINTENKSKEEKKESEM